MGKKKIGRNCKNKMGPSRKERTTARAPTSPSTTLYDTVSSLFRAGKYDQVLEFESKYADLQQQQASFVVHDHDDPPVLDDVHMMFAFGASNMKRGTGYLDRAIDYWERGRELIDNITNCWNELDQVSQAQISTTRANIGMNLPLVYSEGPATMMEKAISSHRWYIADLNRDKLQAEYLYGLSRNFHRFRKYEYAIEVLEGAMDFMETLESVEDHAALLFRLSSAYVECDELLKAKALNEKLLSMGGTNVWTLFLSGRMESGMCNYEAAIDHFRNAILGCVVNKGDRALFSLTLGTALLNHTMDNEDEAFAIFQGELDRCVLIPVGPKHEILLQMGLEYRKLKKWSQAIETHRQLCLSASTRPESTIIRSQANKAMTCTYLEQYCADETLNIDQRNEILNQATAYSQKADEVSTEMHLIHAQLFYCNGFKQQAYHHLELYLDGFLAECKLKCFTCKQRVRHGSVPFSCASCKAASYCDRRHQKLTWNNERMCHKVFCPLLGYWRMTKKRRKRDGNANEDQSGYVRVFEAFFGSICPHVKASSIPSYYDDLIFVD